MEIRQHSQTHPLKEATPHFRENKAQSSVQSLSSFEFRKMAEANIPVDQLSVDQFSCPVCLDLLKDPVTIHCGHSYCMVCINDCWDQEDKSGVYSCPQCRDTFTPRPFVRRNIMLAEVVEKLKKAEVQATSPAHCYAGPGDVECDFCTGRKNKAVKSCLICLASFCDTHLKPHYQSPEFKKHTIIEASADLREKICCLHDEVLKIYCQTNQISAAVQIILPSEPKSREDFLQYFCDLTLDPNTVNYNLILSEKNKAVTHSVRNQPYSDHPERFDYYWQVLSKESVCGRCYWEVEWSGVDVYISVSYKDISRKGRGNERWFGHNNQSWSLYCFSSSLFFCHNNIRIGLRVPPSSRIGVYVDHSAGTLSFYSVSDTMKLLHRVHTTFTQPLYAGFWLPYCGSTLRLCNQK
ncbi:hypothetical protein AMELA_G00016420 [Ameiurus melas]|uniref:Tripartite motif-containing protein 16-like n=1 Tax=Ameiurus melas TaxID=219545 RepID=A0A7J6BAP0_AMEME|nr:hypothetical protein AMELA_G00016420 [Ameiurus melas]